MMASCKSNLADPGAQTRDSRESSLGKESALVGAKISSVFSEDIKNGVQLDLYFRLERGAHGKWSISCSNVSEVDHLVDQTSNRKPTYPNPDPKPFVSFKPNNPFKPFDSSVGHNPFPKPSGLEVNPSVDKSSDPKPSNQASDPKPIVAIKPIINPSVGQNSNPKPNGRFKLKYKPVFKWKPKHSQPALTHSHINLTHSHTFCSSPVTAAQITSSVSSLAVIADNPSLTHFEPLSTETIPSMIVNLDASVNEPKCSDVESTCSETIPSVLDNSEASVTESMCSDASVDESLCSDDEAALHRDIHRIIHEHTDNVIKKWGNSEQWVLELHDGKRVAVPIQISLPPGDVVFGVDESDQWPTVPIVSAECKEPNPELVKGDFCSEDDSQLSDSSPPLNVEPLAISLPRGVMDISEGSATQNEESLLGKENFSEWFQEKFSGFDDFLGTSLNGLEEPATNFLLAVETKLQKRAIKEQTEKALKSSGRKGIRELRGLFSSVNYGPASPRRIGFGLNRLIIDEGALPLLERLDIGDSPQLKEVPSGIHHLKSLKNLQFYEMPTEFVLSLQPDEGPDFGKVKHIPSVTFRYRTHGENYNRYTLGNSALLKRLRS
nr:putative disease resistance rpp8-like protein 4 [Quercus suber]